jgi:protein-S-isoprenylcysteine O-methyltransferase Ste14
MNLIDHGLIPGIWVAFWGYWLVSGRRVKKARKAEPRLARIIHVVLICFAFALITLPVLHVGFLGFQLLPKTAAAVASGVALLIAGLAFAVWGRTHIGEYWSGTITVKEGHRLIRTGPYALVRHPIYAGLFVGVFGTVMATGEVRDAVALALLGVVHFFKIRREERWLVQEFGAQYLQYRKEVSALVPFRCWKLTASHKIGAKPSQERM